MDKRLDVYLYESGYFESREKAKRMIMAGNVFINGERKDKPGEKVKRVEVVEIKDKDIKYVGRGGLKLEKALHKFNLNVKDKIALDIGASTGGFTDCLLQNGAKKVYAVDVGYGQLDYRLRVDPRVAVLERMNFRHMSFEDIGEQVDIATMDVSFISITKLLDKLRLFLKDEGEGILLIKPQFEAGREFVGKNGIVKDEKVHKFVLNKMFNILGLEGFKVLGLNFSPIKGTKGNIEFICHVKKELSKNVDNDDLHLIEEVVCKSHKLL